MRKEHINSGDSILTDPQFRKEMAKIWKNTLGTNKKLLQQLNVFPAEILSILDTAVTARNEIAHDVAMNVDDNIDGELDERICHILELVRKIALADLIVSMLVILLNKDSSPGNDFVASYIDRVVNWVAESTFG